MNRKGFMIDNLGWLILGLATVLIVVILILVFRGPMQKLVDVITGVLRFG